MDREFQASPSGYEKVLIAFEESGKTREFLSDQANCSRSTLNKFIAGQPVGRKEFQAICEVFGLDYREIVDGLVEEDNESERGPGTRALRPIDILVQTVRQQVDTDILTRCGQMRILDMEKPIKYNDIYTNIDVLEAIPGRTQLDFAEMLARCQSNDFGRLSLGTAKQLKVSGREVVDRYSKLIVWGKPGAGKTTFLKRLAMLCRSGDFQRMRVPVFVTLQDFAAEAKQPSLLNYIDSQWSEQGVTENAHTLLSAGLALVLLDGLDDVHEDDSERVLQEIRDFADRYQDCQILMTCRTAARECHLPQFTEVELADFDEVQIADFVTKWFKAENDPWKASQMLAQLQSHRPVQELATNPLLLTWLCRNFVDEVSFPGNRSELYKEGLSILLKRWSFRHNISQTRIYRKLWLTKSEDLLSRLAFDTFERGEYFFQKSTVEQHITDYIRHLPGAAIEETALRLDSSEVLKSLVGHGVLVERAQGIFSFPHLTWHEYLTAKQIVDSLSTQEHKLLPRWVRHIADKRWREVFFSVVGILPDASHCLLMIKQGIDGMLAGDEQLQQFLVWLDGKCRSIKPDGETVKLHLFYLFLDLSLSRYVSLSLDLFLSRHTSFSFDLDLYLSLFRSHYLAQAIENVPADCNPEFLDALLDLQRQLPTQEADFLPWREVYLADWRQQLRALMIQYRNIGHDWQFTLQRQENLEKYYLASKLLKDCLESECYIDIATRKYITDTFCCPVHLLKHHPHWHQLNSLQPTV